MTKPHLLDVNVLIALLDAEHVFHSEAREWFRRDRKAGWATTPMTQNGCMRVMGRPGYPIPGLSLEQVGQILSSLVAGEDHVFWPDSVSLLDHGRIDWTLAASKHLTDLYLLALAIANGGRLVTFDRSIPWNAVPGAASDDVVVLAR